MKRSFFSCFNKLQRKLRSLEVENDELKLAVSRLEEYKTNIPEDDVVSRLEEKKTNIPQDDLKLEGDSEKRLTNTFKISAFINLYS